MKKIFLLLGIAIAVTGTVFAQNYTVQEVKGKVERESGNQRVAVAAGETLAANTVIHTGLGASVVLKEGDNVVTISSRQSGRLSVLAASASGARIQGNVATIDTTEVNRVTGQASTASARASDMDDE